MGRNNRIVELYENKDQVLNAAIDRVVVEILNRKKEVYGQKLLLTGCSPLAGTTSICIALGIAIANTGRKVVLVDCDVRKFMKYKKLNEVTENGLSNYLVKQGSPELVTEDIVYKTNVRGLEFIPCGYCEENPTRVLCSDRFPTLINQLSKQYDCIIFDVPSLAVVPDAQVLFPYMDGIALVTALGETKKRHIKDSKRLVAPFAENYYGMIINKVSKGQYKNANKEFNYYLIDKSGNQQLTENISQKKLRRMQEGSEQ